MKINLISMFLIFIFLFNIVSSAQIIEVPQEQPKKTGLWESIKSVFTSPIFWGAVVIFLLFVVIAIGLFFIIRWLINYFREQKDVYFMMKKDRIKMAKVHRSYGSKHWFKVHKNTPIRLVREVNGKPQVSRPIAYHRGDMKTQEGNIIMALNFDGKNKLFFFPETDLLIIPNKEKVKVEQRENGALKIVEMTIPTASEIVKYNENEVLIYAESLSKSGLFYIPVLKTKDGTILDLTLPAYQTLKEVVIGDYLFEQSSQFVTMNKKAVEMNPNVKIQQKIGDNNQAVDVQTSNQQ